MRGKHEAAQNHRTGSIERKLTGKRAVAEFDVGGRTWNNRTLAIR